MTEHELIGEYVKNSRRLCGIYSVRESASRSILDIKEMAASMPDNESFKSNSVSFCGITVRYNPSMHEEANHTHGGIIEVSDRFLACDSELKAYVLIHEKCHDFADRWLKEEWTKHNASLFVHASERNGEPMFENIFGNEGSNCLSEGVTDSFACYFYDPEFLKNRSESFNGSLAAFEHIDGLVRNWGISDAFSNCFSVI